MLFVLLPVEKAAIWSLLGGYLLLPSAFEVNLPMVPSINKASVTGVSTLLLCLMKGAKSRPARPSWIVYLFVLGLFVSPLLTSLNNSYELETPSGSIPGFYPPDALKLAVTNLITLAPFYVGARYLCTDRGRALLLESIVVAALIYSLPMLLEVRLSPQLHRWVYGYYPYQFGQQMRNGGFRPSVFLTHGLEVALFASLAVIGAAVLMRARSRIMNLPARFVAPYLGVILILCKSLGALAYSVVLVPLVLFTAPRFWTKVACIVLSLACAYPVLRVYDLVPVHEIADATTSISEDRAGSFQFRVKNEDQLLARANQKPLLGWGTWGRNRVRDTDSGRDTSVTDGTWIIQYGMFGWLGYFSLFGLLAAAAFRAAKSVGDEGVPRNIVLGGLTLLLAANIVDLLPNSNLTPLTFLIAGSIAASVPARAAGRSATRQVSGGRVTTRLHEFSPGHAQFDSVEPQETSY